MKTFDEFLTEAKPPKPDALQTVTNNLQRKYPGLKLTTSDNPNGIRIHGMHFPRQEQGKGKGSRTLKILSGFADRHDRQIRLSPEAEPGNQGRLVKFYKKSGFKKDPNSTMNTYVRMPKTKKK
jgi:hypothetical protein